MSPESRTFSESWYRIANQSVCLRSQVTCRRQFFRGEKWYVLNDPFNNRFFRLRPAAYDFIAHLHPSKTVQQVWDETMRRNPDDAPGQEDVIQLLAQLYHANLLHYNLPADSAKLFERYRVQRSREIRSKLLSIMFARFPLLDPDAFLRMMMPLLRPFLGVFGAVIWLAVVISAGKVAIDNFDLIRQQSQGVLAPGNLALLYLGLVIIKTLHEFGHAFVCRHFGGEVHEMGVMLLVFTPIPYMDATSAWAFRSRWQRIYVGAAGMLVEVFVAACATFVWANTDAGTAHSLAYNIMFVASVSTVLFNGNPLLRYDGYYMLSDLLDIPNLHTQCQMQLTHLVERYAFGCIRSTSPANTRVEATLLTVFGISSAIYRIVVFTGIVIFVADKFLLIGLLMAVFCVFSWGVVPIFRLVRYLATSPRLDRTRGRAVWVTCGAAVTVVIVLAAIPFPNRFRAPGVLQTEEHPYVVNATEGYVEEIYARTGSHVTTGQKLVRLRDVKLELEMAMALAEREEADLLLLRSLNRDAIDAKAIEGRIHAVDERIRHLQSRQESLVVVANQEGLYTAPRVDQLLGMWLPRGTVIGQILNRDAYRFAAIVAQKEASRLFDKDIRKAEIRLKGQGDIPLRVTELKFIPGEQETLPSAAVGWGAGGEIKTDAKDTSGLKAAEAFFVVQAAVEPHEHVAFYHGRSGKIRYELPPEALLRQWTRMARQMLQERYNI